MDNRGARILVKVLFLIYLGMVLFFCFFNFSNTDLELPKTFLGIPIDKVVHFVMFLPYPFIGWLTYRYSRHLGRYKEFALSMTFITGLLFAVFTELAQKYMFEPRSGEFLDFVADFCGIAVGSIIIKFIGEWMIGLVERIVPDKKTE